MKIFNAGQHMMAILCIKLNFYVFLYSIETSVVPNDSLVLSSNLKSLADLKSESSNKKLDRESLKQVSWSIQTKKIMLDTNFPHSSS